MSASSFMVERWEDSLCRHGGGGRTLKLSGPRPSPGTPTYVPTPT